MEFIILDRAFETLKKALHKSKVWVIYLSHSI